MNPGHSPSAVRMDTIRQDLTYAVRAMRKRPGVTAVIVLSLALGIGANTAIFTIVHAVLVRELPYEDPERLAAIWLQQPAQPNVKMFATYRDFELLQQTAQSYEDVAGNNWAVGGRTLLWRGEPHFVTAIPSTHNLFSLLGVQAAHGRTFVPEDLNGGCSVVLADRFWRNDLGAEPSVVNGTIMLDDEACSVVGVMPAGFEFFPRQTEAWTLITPASALASNPMSNLAIFGRLKPGLTREAAAAEAALVHQRVGDELPAGSFARDTTLGVYDLQREFTFLAGANLRAALLMLTAAVAIVLLICCVNVAGVMLGRGAERQKSSRCGLRSARTARASSGSSSPKAPSSRGCCVRGRRACCRRRAVVPYRESDRHAGGSLGDDELASARVHGGGRRRRGAAVRRGARAQDVARRLERGAQVERRRRVRQPRRQAHGCRAVGPVDGAAHGRGVADPKHRPPHVEAALISHG